MGDLNFVSFVKDNRETYYFQNLYIVAGSFKPPPWASKHTNNT